MLEREKGSNIIILLLCTFLHKGCYRKLSSSSRTVQKVEYVRRRRRRSRHLDRRELEGSFNLSVICAIVICSVQSRERLSGYGGHWKVKGKKRRLYALHYDIPQSIKLYLTNDAADFETACFLSHTHTHTFAFSF